MSGGILVTLLKTLVLLMDLTSPLLLDILNAAPVGMLLVDEQGRIVFANKGMKRLFGWNWIELSGLPISILIPERIQNQHERMRRSYTEDPHPRRMGERKSLCAMHHDGHEVPVEIGLSPIIIDNQKYVLASLLDISGRIRADAFEEVNLQLEHLATHDPLTGLANRSLITEFIRSHIEERRNSDLWAAVAFIDLDGFKRVNDDCGHNAGDELLFTVAKSINNQLRSSDCLGRIGGDEFLVCVTGFNSANSIRQVFESLITSIDSITEVTNCPVDIGASIGVVVFLPNKSIDVNALIAEADELMYQAKSEGKGRVVQQIKQAL
ncbi:MAG: diguanylate cyclase (GGDEF)-like protein/PAS domain S-box-containing protein [Flavobacteriales bacterium]|jgi:diguanylate cyclase (GGDEF)-like protein/PAS domain S-box-containing protein